MQGSRHVQPSGFVPAVNTAQRESKERFQAPPVTMVLWSHEPRISPADVIVDMALLPASLEGDVAEMTPLDSKKRAKVYFVVRKVPPDVDKSMSNVQISVSSSILSLLDITPRSKVKVKLCLVTPLTETSKHEVEADLVEILFKDTYLTRADMWRMSSRLIGQCLYSSQRVSYCDVVRSSVQHVYRDGHKAFSAYIGPNTKFVYRSEAARMIYFIQMSSEMWNFVENGEIMFHKLVNSFLPEVFKRWRDQGAHHIVSIVLFTSVSVSNRSAKLGQGERDAERKDYFRVVVDQVHISRWGNIMATLRYEFARFAKDVLQSENGNIKGRILPAVKGNLLEAINFATSLVSSKFSDRDLRRTGIQVLIVTPGTGIYDVDYDLLYHTSQKLLSIEIGIDLVCLSRPPLHVTPLFRYKSHDKVVNCLPSWLDISFWDSTERYAQQWIPRCKIYDIQMMGIMENEVNAISIEMLKIPTDKPLRAYMKDYDANVYLSKSAIANQRMLEEASSTTTPSVLLRPQVSMADVNSTSVSSLVALRSTVSKSIPATAIISSPTTEVGSSGALFTSKVKSRDALAALAGGTSVLASGNSGSRVSALTSLLSLGKGTRSALSSPSLSAVSPKITPIHSSDSDVTSLDSVASSSTARKDSLVSPTNMSLLPAASIGTSLTPKSLIAAGDLKVEFASSDSASKDGTHDSSKVSSSSARPGMAPRQGSFNRSHLYKQTSKLGSGLAAAANQVTAASPTTQAKDQNEGSNNHIWVTISDPSKVSNASALDISKFGRWRNVFPKSVKRRAVKWQSMKAPAALPLATDLFPSVEDFAKNYTFQLYDVTLDPEKEEEMTSGELLEEMIALRLHIGFQIVVGDRVSKVEAQRRPGGNPALIVQTIPKQDYYGIRIYMTRRNQVHRLAIDHYGTINIQLYSKTDETEDELTRSYHPLIKTRFDNGYRISQGNFFDPSIRLVNWNLIDQALAGYGEGSAESFKMCKIRFVFIPSELPNMGGSGPGGAGGSMSKNPWDGNSEKLTAEEIRVEGLRRIILTLHRGAYLTPQEMRIHKNRKKEEVPPDINFYTGDLGSFLIQLYEESRLEIDGRKKHSLISKSTERLNRNIKLQQLASEMQSDKGVHFVDRRWHWKTHRNCFVGHEFVAWTIESFTDIDTTEQAVEFGNNLMDEGFFRHVEDRHSFLDGYYFYQLMPEYVIQDESKFSRTGWFSKRSHHSQHSTATQALQQHLHSHNSDSSTPVNTPVMSGVSGGSSNNTPSVTATPSSNVREAYFRGLKGHKRKSSGSGVTHLTPDVDASGKDSASSIRSGNTARSDLTDNPPTGTEPVSKVLISQLIKYNVDPSNRSKRPEFMSVHIDKVHNPENAFHLRMEWLNTTPKLIDEAIVNLTRLGDRYGLRLVQAPLEEISSLQNDNPFCSIKNVSFCIDVPSPSSLNDEKQMAYLSETELTEEGGLTEEDFASILSEDPLYYHKYFLARRGFVVDTVAASTLLNKEVDIQYSWGKPFYNYSQYIHEDGMLLAQVVGDESFVFLINSLHVSRIGVQTGPGSHQPAVIPRDLILDLERICNDEGELRAIFAEGFKDWQRKQHVSSEVSSVNQVETA